MGIGGGLCLSEFVPEEGGRGGSAVWFEGVGGKDPKGTGERGCRVQWREGRGEKFDAGRWGKGRGG